MKKNEMKVVLDKNAYMPEYAHETDAGMDIRTPYDVVIPARITDVNEEYGVVVPESGIAVHTGVHVEIPKGCAGFFKSKSGLNVKHGITSEGVIDEGYTGELVVKLYNHTSEDYELKAGDKITQLVILPVTHVTCVRAESLADTDRGDKGFGSTGK